jgi:hypothetical protein
MTISIILFEREYRRWVSDRSGIQCPPLLPDPYESRTVSVATSPLPGAGQGLFARGFFSSFSSLAISLSRIS